MQYTNSYFTLDIEDNEIYMNYYPAVSDGEKLKIPEVTEILDRNKIENYDLNVIKETLLRAEQPTRVRICNQGAYQFDETMEIKVTPDAMYAVVRFYPPSNKGKRMSESEIRRDLEYHKVTYGIQDDVIEKHIASPEYFKNILVAVGQKPVQGKDGYITYHFDTDRKAKPRLKDDGTVDFHQLDNIAHVRKGDILADITPAIKGEMGYNVYGGQLPPEKVIKVYFKYGKNIKISEDQLQLISDVDGYAVLEGDRVFVSNLYEIENDVDNSTGDVAFNGSILVRGNVRTGFKLKADGDIEVYGVVEGAELDAGGDVILHRGIQGMNRCVIRAKGNLVCGFIESATISAEGNIEAGSIFNSNVSAKGEIKVSGKGGSIIGGYVRATNLIEATSIGTTMGSSTAVEVGIDPSIRDRIKEIEIQIKNKTAEVDKLDQLLAVFRKKQELGTLDKEKQGMINQFTKTIIMDKTEIKTLQNEYEEKMDSLSTDVNAKIMVVKDIHSGTKITISGNFIILHDTLSHCQFTLKNGEIVSGIW